MFDLDPQVDLDNEGVLIPQVFIDFDPQFNILPKKHMDETWSTITS